MFSPRFQKIARCVNHVNKLPGSIKNKCCLLRGLFRRHNLRIYTILPSHFRMNPPAEIGNSLPSGDDVSALTSSTRTLSSSTSTTTDTPPVVI